MVTVSKADLDDIAVENFRTYLRIPSVHPDVNYDECVTFIKNLAEDVGLPSRVLEFVKGKPIVIITWQGTQQDLPAILFNSHMDVVPVFAENWTHDPFGAEIDSEGNIYGRGAQDMKSVGVQYLEAARRLFLKGFKPKRTIHFSYVPDEEIGGGAGMQTLVTSKEFQELDIGCAFDEGSATPGDGFLVFYGERTVWQLRIVVNGTTGHGSLLLPDTAGEKLRRLLDRFMDYRQSQVDRLTENPNLTIGDVTTVNLTIIEGGVEENVVPPQLSATFDIRIAIDVPLEKFESQLRTWADESGDRIEFEYIEKDEFVEPTKLDDSNPYWVAMKQKTDELGLLLVPLVMFGATDSRYIRKLGLPAISFSPMNKTPPLAHADNEFLNKDVFLRGIDIYASIISGVSNASE